MSPSKKGLFVSLILALGFMAGGVWLKKKFYSQTDHTNKKTLEILESDGALPIALPHALTGETVSLSDFKGKFTIVHFWATWCAPCVEEFPSMIKFLENYGDKVVFLAISVDEEKADIATFLNAFGAENKSLIVLWDIKNEVAPAWGTSKLPESYILNPDHKLVKKIASSENWGTPMVFRYFDDLLSSYKGSNQSEVGQPNSPHSLVGGQSPAVDLKNKSSGDISSSGKIGGNNENGPRSDADESVSSENPGASLKDPKNLTGKNTDVREVRKDK